MTPEEEEEESDEYDLGPTAEETEEEYDPFAEYVKPDADLGNMEEEE